MLQTIQQAAHWLNSADAVLITASNGLSISEGYHIFADNEDFRTYFGEFRERYGISCLIRGVFTPMPPEDRQRYMAQVRKYLVEDYTPSHVMQDLLALVREKNYFILTSNGDTHFQQNGFAANRIFEIEGNVDGLEMHSARWMAQQERYLAFLDRHRDAKLTVLELGIGIRNQMIKQPTMDMVRKHAGWNYITMNMPQEILLPAGAENRSIAITGDIGKNFQELLKEMNLSQ